MSPADVAGIDSPEFFALAYRLPAYSGVMRMRVEQEQEKTSRNVRPGAKLVESERKAIERDPLLADLIDFG